eukprot:6207652-Pleurochrysis_carterae.AAC.5
MPWTPVAPTEWPVTPEGPEVAAASFVRSRAIRAYSSSSVMDPPLSASSRWRSLSCSPLSAMLTQIVWVAGYEYPTFLA